MRIILASNRRAVDRIAQRDAARSPAVERQAARIVDDVRRRGDTALVEWTRKLQPAKEAGLLSAKSQKPGFLDPLSRADLRRGWNATPAHVRRALTQAASHIEGVAECQIPHGFAINVAPGLRIEQRVQPLGRVGCYVPGGRYPLPSTLLMTVIPARVAGVKETVVVCPRPAPVVLAAALVAGATEVYVLGGAQAIAALAYGTKSIARVDKIVGPGNAWVAAAKALVSPDCAIDFHAGPSEIVVHSDNGRPDFIAADLIAQAEHDPAARAIFVTTKRTLAGAVVKEVARQMPASGPARESIARNGAAIVARTTREALALVNRLAPEHLVVDEDADVDAYRAAGTIFVGRWSVQASGDYATGSNHVLPTGGAARFRGGLNAADFVRTFTVQRLTRRGLGAIADTVVALADAEGLTAHAESVRVRGLAPPTGSGPARRKPGPTPWTSA